MQLIIQSSLILRVKSNYLYFNLKRNYKQIIIAPIYENCTVNLEIFILINISTSDNEVACKHVISNGTSVLYCSRIQVHLSINFRIYSIEFIAVS